MMSALSADITGNATVGLAAATTVLAVVTAVGVCLTRRALNVANRDTQEAIKSRTDQRAPLVVVVELAPAASVRTWHSDKAEIVETSPGEVAGSGELSLMGWFRIVNQGRSTALVSVPDGVLVLPRDAAVQSLNAVKYQRPVAYRLSLEPGQSSVMLVQAFRSVEQWKEVASQEETRRSPITVTFKVGDTFSDGIRDTITLKFHGVPIRRDGNVWMEGAIEATRLEVGRTQREYPELPPIS